MKLTTITVCLWLMISVLALVTTFITLSNIHNVTGLQTLGIIIGDAFSLLTFFTLLKLYRESTDIDILSGAFCFIFVVLCIATFFCNAGMLSNLVSDEKDKLTSVNVLCVLAGDVLVGITTYSLFTLRKGLY